MPFNSKARDQVLCWYCEHFQRYERGETPESCAGECRRKALVGQDIGITSTSVDYGEFKMWPVIGEAGTVWCGEFLRSREKDLPPVPPLENDDCEEELTLPDDHNNFYQEPWNKKILSGYVDSQKDGICCWNCDHFQRTESGSEPRTTIGECRRRMPDVYASIVEFGETGYYNSQWYRLILNTVCVWCSEWERARHDVPVPFGGWDIQCTQQQEETLVNMADVPEVARYLEKNKITAAIPTIGKTSKKISKKSDKTADKSK